MPQSEEHKFVTSTFIQAVEKLSKSELYGYTEADRGGFDFACILERDRSRPLVGQTLTHHSEGIEKDINWLLFAESAEIPVYLYSDTARNVTRIRDTLHRARSSMADKVELMRLYSYPASFDADSESQRDAIHGLILEKVADDLLMNILFGRLTYSDISMFLNEIGMPGFLLACLEEFARRGMLNYSDLSSRLDAKPATTRARVQSLWAAGMLQQRGGAVYYRLTQRARIFLKICHILSSGNSISFELAYILDRLGLSGLRDPISPFESPRERIEAQPEALSVHRRRQLITEIRDARENWGVEISGGPYVDTPMDIPDVPNALAHLPWVGR